MAIKWKRMISSIHWYLVLKNPAKGWRTAAGQSRAVFLMVRIIITQQNLIFQTIAANWPKIRHIEKNWVPIERKLSQLSAELYRFELRPLRAKIFNDKVVRIIMSKTLVRIFTHSCWLVSSYHRDIIFNPYLCVDIGTMHRWKICVTVNFELMVSC